MTQFERFQHIGEPYAAGLFEHPSRSRFYRLARAQRRYWESVTLPAYNGCGLYPHGRKCPDAFAVRPDYSYTYSVDAGALAAKDPDCAVWMGEEAALLPLPRTPHTVGGNGYTHSIPHYGRVLAEGLDAYAERVRALSPDDFRDGLFEVLEGVRLYRDRMLRRLETDGAPSELLDALQRVPFAPARTLYEALVGWNLLYYIDGCDNPGRLDQDLFPYYRGEDATALLRAFFHNVDENDGWSAALGPDCNPLTLQCLRAVHGLRRPSLELRVTGDMPDAVWEEAVAALRTGCGQPALYNEAGYQAALAARFPDIPPEDLARFNGGGCTETMLAGVSNVGSLDLGINLALIFARYLRARLAECPTFEAFRAGLMRAIYAETADALDQLNRYRAARAETRPQPVRTLLIDDCIDKGLDFNAGGARYAWSVVNFAGLVNVIDSLLAVRALVYDAGLYTAAEFVSLLDGGDPLLAKRLRAAPCFGVDDAEADAFAADVAAEVFGALRQRTPYLGRAFLPASIQFVTYAEAGACVPATPDGRADGAPLADSIGAVHGKDRRGPTALLRSAARLPQAEAIGTPVLNLRLQKPYLEAHLKTLVEGYFAAGGLQVQISCVDRAELEDAVAHPERHENLIVRIGGYSEYFARLSPALQRTVLERTEHGG